MRTLTVMTILTTLVLPPVAFAEVQTFTATHTYILGDHDSKDDARQRCLLEAKRKVLEQAGVYIESASEVKNFDLTKDKITSFAAAVMQVKDTKEEVGFQQGHMTMTLKLTAQVDLEEVRKQLAARQLDAGVRDTVAAQQESLKRLEAQLEAMQQQQGGNSSGHVPGSTPGTIQVPRTVNGLNLVQYADRALDLDRVPVENIRVAVVNPQFVLERSKAGMRAQATHKEYVRTKQNILRLIEDDLRAQEVNMKKIPESNPDRTAVHQKLVNDINAYKEKAREFNDDLVHRQAEWVQEYSEKLQKVIGRVASMSGIDLVLNNFSNLEQAKGMLPPPVLELLKRATKDLTADGIEEFDRTYK
jgi:outer membrane protein